MESIVTKTGYHSNKFWTKKNPKVNWHFHSLNEKVKSHGGHFQKKEKGYWEIYCTFAIFNSSRKI